MDGSGVPRFRWSYVPEKIMVCLVCFLHFLVWNLQNKTTKTCGSPLFQSSFYFTVNLSRWWLLVLEFVSFSFIWRLSSIVLEPISLNNCRHCLALTDAYIEKLTFCRSSFWTPGATSSRAGRLLVAFRGRAAAVASTLGGSSPAKSRGPWGRTITLASNRENCPAADTLRTNG